MTINSVFYEEDLLSLNYNPRLNLSIPMDVIFVDLAKAAAFDSVPRERLLLKLKSNGIDGCY